MTSRNVRFGTRDSFAPPRNLSRLILAALSLLMVSGVARAQANITSLSVDEATIGTIFDVSGTGFGAAKPKVFLADAGAKVKGNKLKVLDFSDTSISVVVKKAVLGTYTVVVVPGSGASDESADTIEVMAPVVAEVDDGVLRPGEVATISVEWASTAKVGVAMGGLSAKVLDVSAQGGTPPSWDVMFRVPNVPNGTWGVEFTNPLGTVGSASGIRVVGSETTIVKQVFDARLADAKPFKTQLLDVSSSFDGPTTVAATKKGVSWSLELPFVLGNDLAPQSYDANEASLHYLDLKTSEEYETADEFTVIVSAVADGLVAGSFSGVLESVMSDAPARLVSGTFIYDGAYDMDTVPGGTDTHLEPAEDAPPINVQILSVDGATGPTGDFVPGDSVAVTFRLAKDDGTAWKLSEMNLARAILSGPTSNYQRVIPQQSDVAAASVDHGDGTYTYTFPPLPETFQAPYNDTASFDEDDGEMTGQPLSDGTYTFALIFRWEYSVEGATYRRVGERTYDFLVGTTPQFIVPRQVVSTDNCNQCHSTLQAHGGQRRGSEVCVLCHTAGSEDRNNGGATPGASIAWNIMVHKIHNGAHLPSVLGVGTDVNGDRVYTETPEPYVLVGFSTADFSEVHFPAWPNLVYPMPRDLGYNALSSTEKGLEDTMRSGVTNCALCHGDPDGEGPLAAPLQGDNAYENPSYNACAACHDDWELGEKYKSNGQTMGENADDSNCTLCHDASGTDLSVMDAHRHPLLDTSFATGVNFNLIDVTDAGPGADLDGNVEVGEKVAVTFSITDAFGLEVDPADLNRHNVMISGPSNNMQVLTPEMSIPAEVLTGSQPYTMNVPMRVYYEPLGIATAGADAFASDFTPHWDATGHATDVFEVTGATAGGGSSTLAAAVTAPVNYIDVVNGANFDRDDMIAIVGATTEYLKIQVVDGNRLWFSSPYATAYAPGPQVDHSAGVAVVEVDMVELTVTTDYTLDTATGTVTEAAAWGDGNPILASYTSDFVLPATYGLALNAGPDLGENSGTWAGKSMVAGTYSLGMWGHIARSFDPLGVPADATSYNDGAPGQRYEFLVGGATSLEPWENISSVDNCYQCHVDIQFHGNNRRGVDACLMCHGTAGSGDRPQYVAPNAPATDGTTINFREMIHTIHTGADLEHPDEYEVIGFGSGFPNNFSIHTYEEVHFPAMPSGTQDCTKCHGADSEAWFQPSSREHPTEQNLAVQEWTLVCGSCHDGDVAQAHIETQSSPISGAEACPTCHAPGQAWAANILHKVR